MSSDILPLTREKLHELVWQEPMLKVAARYGVASMYMTRVCIELRVPRPGAGHWSKVAFGKAPPRPPLPSARVGDLTEWQPGTVFATARQADQPRVRSIRAKAFGGKTAKAGQAAVAVEKALTVRKPAVVLTVGADRKLTHL